MRLQQYMITELFDTKVPIKFVGKDGGISEIGYEYAFDVDNEKYRFRGFFSHFSEHGSILSIEFDKDGSYEMTNVSGTGDTLKVFSAVKLCLLDLMKRLKTKPDTITFDADVSEPSRVRLYDRFMKMIPRVLKGYKFDKKITTGTEKDYYFKKKGR
jgi:hypothetical protein